MSFILCRVQNACLMYLSYFSNVAFPFHLSSLWDTNYKMLHLPPDLICLLHCFLFFHFLLLSVLQTKHFLLFYLSVPYFTLKLYQMYYKSRSWVLNFSCCILLIIQFYLDLFLNFQLSTEFSVFSYNTLIIILNTLVIPLSERACWVFFCLFKVLFCSFSFQLHLSFSYAWIYLLECRTFYIKKR